MGSTKPYLFLCLLTLHSLFYLCFSHSDNSLVLVISFDGFRWDYLEKAKTAGKSTPSFDYLISSGVSIKGPGGVKNVFATFTFPNHYSLATGLYAENHGVVHNEMFDPDTNETFRNTPTQNEDSKWWDNGTPGEGPEPIWIANQHDSPQALFKKRSGVYFWPGSLAVNHGTRPFHYKSYDETVTNKTRINTMLEWFSTEDNPINLGFLYFDQPDAMGHLVGPDHPALIDNIVALDDLVGYLLNEMERKHLHKRLNLVITSDHGMTAITNYISVDEFVDPISYNHYGESPVWHIVPEPGMEEQVYESFKKVPNATLYKKEEIPEHFHYKHNKRIMPLILVADKGQMLCHNVSTCYLMNGDHGYTNEDLDMQPMFVAHGPAFKRDFKVDQFEIVDIYPLLCHLLDIEPSPHDGDLERVEIMLEVHDNSLITTTTSTIVFSLDHIN
ncbi:hypothetical protein CAPTEDRAFT_2758 [Capitella teleta]|uniref:Ectonucleotide pyrophosphatase/phosphodiesterase family member 5 n=1 Tax=Capitella teleta TaxID=283909 RepID=R7U979_CAPTE|nr:hypothetical protein CAPTEDRAFT_2758 [Capitella teleta]|eukprot:ELU02519.1 hypothetical protein CAPTEDRAFT_2758 [Capitella teleta]